MIISWRSVSYYLHWFLSNIRRIPLVAELAWNLILTVNYRKKKYVKTLFFPTNSRKSLKTSLLQYWKICNIQDRTELTIIYTGYFPFQSKRQNSNDLCPLLSFQSNPRNTFCVRACVTSFSLFLTLESQVSLWIYSLSMCCITTRANFSLFCVT